LLELRSFVEQGGTLITLGAASEVPVAYGWTPGVTVSKPSSAFRAIGPIVAATITGARQPALLRLHGRDHPGQVATATLYAVAPTAGADVLLRFQGGPEGLLSGELNGIEEISGRPAIIRAPLGQGQILMFATNPMFRHQNIGGVPPAVPTRSSTTRS